MGPRFSLCCLNHQVSIPRNWTEMQILRPHQATELEAPGWGQDLGFHKGSE